MKIKAITLLVFFVSFLALPTLLSKVCNDVDVSMAYTIAEEEENHNNNISEIFNDFTSEENEIFLGFFGLTKGKITDEFLLKHDNIFSKIFSPPPEKKLV